MNEDIHPAALDAGKTALALIAYNMAQRQDEQVALMNTLEPDEVKDLTGVLVAIAVHLLAYMDTAATAAGIQGVPPSRQMLDAMSAALY